MSGGGSGGEMAAETFAQNMSIHMAEQAELPALPARDATGKVHTNEDDGGLPTAADLQKYPTEDLQHFKKN